MKTVFSVEESHWWANSLRPQGGCNVLSALKQVVKRKEIDSIVLVLGSWYDQISLFIVELCRFGCNEVTDVIVMSIYFNDFTVLQP